MDPAQETETKRTTDDEPSNSGEIVDQEGTEEDTEGGKALFDRPLVLEGKRKRKSTELFSFNEKDKARKMLEYTGGEGCRLGDIAYIEHNITKLKSDQLKGLFRLCYDRAGQRLEIKRSLRDFSGYTDKEMMEKKRPALEKLLVPALKSMCELLGLETSGKKEEIIGRILDFLNKPVDLGKVPKKRRRSSTGGGKARKKSKASESDDEKKEDEEEEAPNDQENNGDDDAVMDDSTVEEPKDDSVNKDEAAEKDETTTPEKNDQPMESPVTNNVADTDPPPVVDEKSKEGDTGDVPPVQQEQEPSVVSDNKDKEE